MVKVIRTIHEVGHGAFYTEVFNHDNASKMVVYDCGAQNGTHLKAIIKKLAAINPRPNFEALFVSHFDADHIKGVSELFRRFGKPRFVYIPWLDYAHAILEFGKVLAQGLPSSLYMFAYSLILTQSIPGNQQPKQTSIIRVTPGNYNVQFIMPIWEYIPIVYVVATKKSMADKYLNDLLAAYNASGIRDLIQKIPNDFDKAKEVFINVIGSKQKKFDFNATSLMLYSGPVNMSISNVLSSTPSKTFLGNRISFRIALPKTISSAMYLGDMKMSPRVLNAIDAAIGQRRADRVCLVQMPHHGAASSHCRNYTTCFKSSKIYFCCVRNNDSNHPGSIPMLDVMSARKYLCVIDEDASNTLVETIGI